jgi:hypothetical protein
MKFSFLVGFDLLQMGQNTFISLPNPNPRHIVFFTNVANCAVGTGHAVNFIL